MKTKKILTYCDSDGFSPVISDINNLDNKIKNKALKGLAGLSEHIGYMKEPHVKHFNLERYARLYEYRARIEEHLRIMFALDENEDIILLEAFIKHHDRDTKRALETAIKRLKEIDSNPQQITKFIAA